MPPNTNVKGIVQTALPYDQPVYPKGAGLLETSAEYHRGAGRQQVADDEEIGEYEQAVRITTRTRITYELDRFSKNVMLLIDNSDTALTPLYVQHSSEQRKFQVTFINAQDQLRTTREEVWEKILQFFEQDFSEIGAAAVVIFTSYASRPVVSLADGDIEEWELLRYFAANQSLLYPTTGLQGKPKIFISEISMSTGSTLLQPISMDNGGDLQDMLITKFFLKAR